jgi:hypothetical protein
MAPLDSVSGDGEPQEAKMLHKTSKVQGFHLHATDGEIGHVDDFLFDEECAIRYLVVDTKNFIGGKWVLISTAAVEEIDSENKRIAVNLTRDEIEKSPSVDTADIELVETLPAFVII